MKRSSGNLRDENRKLQRQPCLTTHLAVGVEKQQDIACSPGCSCVELWPLSLAGVDEQNTLLAQRPFAGAIRAAAIRNKQRKNRQKVSTLTEARLASARKLIRDNHKEGTANYMTDKEVNDLAEEIVKKDGCQG